MIAIDLIKQQVLDAEPKAIQQIDFAANLDREGNTRIFFLLEETKEIVRLFTRNCKSIVNILQNAILFNNLIFINIKWFNTIV